MRVRVGCDRGGAVHVPGRYFRARHVRRKAGLYHGTTGHGVWQVQLQRPADDS